MKVVKTIMTKVFSRTVSGEHVSVLPPLSAASRFGHKAPTPYYQDSSAREAEQVEQDKQ